MRNRWWVTTTLAAAALTLAACASAAKPSSGGSHPKATTPASTGSAAAASTSSTVKAAKIGGATVLTNAKGFTLYWFAPDTPTTSKCYGACATYWPPVKGPVTAAAGVRGMFGTIKRTTGGLQATYDGHPLYTYSGDTAPGQANGNGLNASGGVWHEVTESGTAAPAPSASPSASSSSSGGYGGY